ncbi:MAG: hypothetical protein KBT03_06920, partial [Bacteroidales bacterium]|nr:hypothetical protein [Candidatus Scybalousia scybalohippi]
MEEKTTNKYKFTFNENGYIIGGGAVSDDNYDWAGQMSDYKEPRLDYGCYKLVNGNIVKDEQEYQRLKDIETKQNRISELKQKLTETDYIYNSIREG